MFFSLNACSQSDLTSSSDFLKNYRPPNFNYQQWMLSPNVRESGTDSPDFKRSGFQFNMYNDIRFFQQKDRSNT